MVRGKVVLLSEDLERLIADGAANFGVLGFPHS
jgi:hypothetical protein